MPNITIAVEEVQQADILVIIGTSLAVYPAAGLVHYVKPGTPIYLIDPSPAVGSGIQHLTHIQKGASEGMKTLCTMLEGK